MLLEPVDERQVQFVNLISLNIYNEVRFLVDDAFWVGVCPNSNPAGLIRAPFDEGFVEEVV
jgi:hypothetical protein